MPEQGLWRRMAPGIDCSLYPFSSQIYKPRTTPRSRSTEHPRSLRSALQPHFPSLPTLVLTAVTIDHLELHINAVVWAYALHVASSTCNPICEVHPCSPVTVGLCGVLLSQSIYCRELISVYFFILL
jgi:hypothetical protein